MTSYLTHKSHFNVNVTVTADAGRYEMRGTGFGGQLQAH